MAPAGPESRWIFKTNTMVLKNPESTKEIPAENTITPTNQETGDTILKRNIFHIFECMDMAASSINVGYVDPVMIEYSLEMAAYILRETGREQEAQLMKTASFLDLNNIKNVVAFLSQFRKSSNERFPAEDLGCELALYEEDIQYSAAVLGISPNEMFMAQYLAIRNLEARFVRTRQERSEIDWKVEIPEENRIVYSTWRAGSKACQQNLQTKNFKLMYSPEDQIELDAAFPSLEHPLAVLKTRLLQSPRQITLCEISRQMKTRIMDDKKAYVAWRIGWKEHMKKLRGKNCESK